MPKRIRVLRGVRSKFYSADDLTVTLDAEDTLERVTEAVAEHHRNAIRSGRRPSGGSQKGLGPDERKRAGKGKRNSRRGMGSEGRFADSIGSRVSGGDLKAEGTVAADPYFDDWQARERGRSVEYLELDGDVDELVEATLAADLKRKGLSD